MTLRFGEEITNPVDLGGLLYYLSASSFLFAVELVWRALNFERKGLLVRAEVETTSRETTSTPAAAAGGGGDGKIEPPTSGKYRFSSSKNRRVSSTIKLVFSPDRRTGGGWIIHGERVGQSNIIYTIQEGYVASSGKTYWMETTSDDNNEVVLSKGKFVGSRRFMGEWCSSSGAEDQYHEFSLVLADDEV